jgi:hypothetical protein
MTTDGLPLYIQGAMVYLLKRTALHRLDQKMATVTKTNAATISRLLNSADILKSSTGAGRVSTVLTEGFSVTKNFDGQIIVQYVSSSSMKNEKVYEAFLVRRTEALAKIANILADKGYAFGYTTLGNIILEKAGA